MTVELEVIRGLGDKDGGEVVNSLLTCIPAALQRGRFECDKAALYDQVSHKIVFRPGLRKGQIVEVSDPYHGQSWRGVIMSFSLVKDGPDVYADLIIKKPKRLV